MNNHGQVQDRLFAYVDGELEKSEQAELERHLAECEECAGELAVTREAARVFESIPPPPLPDGFMSRLQARIAEHERGGSRGDVGVPIPRPHSPLPPTELASSPSRPAHRPRSRWPAALAAVLVAVVGLIWFIRGRTIADNPALAPAALAYSDGAVEVSHRRVSDATALHVGDEIQTLEGARAVVTLGNNGSVRLGPASRVRVLALDTRPGNGRLDVKLGLEQGAVWVEEAGGVHCALQAGGTMVVPLGTSYLATLVGGLPTISVWDGRVRIVSLVGRARAEVEAGREALVDHAGLKMGEIPRHALENAFVDWNLRLRDLRHPEGRVPLSRPLLGKTFSLPRFLER
jgi:anti-sigma factor RsiW